MGCVDGATVALRISLNAIATPPAREPGPLVTRCRSGTVAKVDSIGGGGAQVHPVSAGSCRNSSNTSSCAAIFAAAYTAIIDRRVGPPVPDVGPAHALRVADSDGYPSHRG